MEQKLLYPLYDLTEDEKNNKSTIELDFLTSTKILETSQDKKAKLSSKDFYELLDKIKPLSLIQLLKNLLALVTSGAANECFSI